ncbi:A24 family peptidase [Vibrio sp. SCSIO 43137]|uniref:A24 family peptidase n=1 Tax=Vibrio sp. SCSIO 43137 TaxID=3021011 RepID=UPI0023077E9E|nr:A24 family peptidase [Vibrio sp. SCSIO 43137]WCE29123.1 A24 family peptidase [Vibrio sp. SCSIO 43137]
MQIIWLSCWGVLFAISLVDLKENRIPNRLVAILFILTLVGNALSASQGWILDSVLGGVAIFALGLFFYFVKAMAAGDVKLLAVIGFWQGWNNLLDLSYYIIIASAIVGSFYFIYNSIYFGSMLNLRKLAYLTNKQTRQYVDVHLTKMPMAPSIAIGMAMYSYFTL